MIQLENISKTTLEHGSKNPFDHFLKSAPDPSELLPSSNLTPQEEVRVWRKIDIRLMPILALIYLFTFLDRGASYPSPFLVEVSPTVTGNIG